MENLKIMTVVYYIIKGGPKRIKASTITSLKITSLKIKPQTQNKRGLQSPQPGLWLSPD